MKLDIEWRPVLIAGVIGGLIGGIILGNLYQQSQLIGRIALIYGFSSENFMAGWVIHLIHSVLLGIAFGVALNINVVLSIFKKLDDAITRVVDNPLGDRKPGFLDFSGIATGGLFGAIYGVVIWITLLNIALPLFMRLRGAGWPLQLFGFMYDYPVETLAIHVFFGLILGVLYYHSWFAFNDRDN